MARTKRGKKAWKKIDTQEVDDFLEKSTREERQGLVVEGVPDADLFFEDKGGDEGTVEAANAGKLPGKLAARQKLLRSVAILSAAHNATPVAKVVPRKSKGSVLEQEQRAKQQRKQAQHAAGGGSGAAAAKKRGGAAAKAAAALDIWGGAGEEGQQLGAAAAAATAPLDWAQGWEGTAAPAAKRAKRSGPTIRHGALVPSTAPMSEQQRPIIPAIEIDPAGCSYNPDREMHQEAVAVAVAAETRKILDKDLQPLAPPRTVDYDVEQDELALLQTLEGGAAEEEGEGEGGDTSGVAAARRRQEALRKTRKDRNKEARRKSAQGVHAVQRKLKVQRHELSSLKAVETELAEEEEEQEAMRMRRQLDKAERLAAEPPKLSKHRFEPMPMQVLTSEELAGSLRRLKPTAMLAKDRFKSLQKRALIEPRRKIDQKKQGKKVEYIHGERADRAAERQAELAEMRQAKKKAKKAKAAA